VTSHELEGARQHSNLPQKEQHLDQKLAEHRTKTRQEMKTHQPGISSEEIQKTIEASEKKFQKEDSRYLVKKAWKKMRNG
jgi:hypothetical protein